MATYEKYLTRWNGSSWDVILVKPASHTHTKSQITDFPTSLPASDVYAWAKASTKPSYSWSEITSKPTTFNQEAYLTWGGKNFSGSYGPIDAAMVGELGANRLAFTPASSITVEYSRDAGSTWIDYGLSDDNKINLFNGVGSSIILGKNTTTQTDTTNYRVRITINTRTATIYTRLNKFVILCSTNGSDGCYCTIQGRSLDNFQNNVETWSTFSNKPSIGGWSGYNVINTNNITTYAEYAQLRFTFGCTSHPYLSYPGLCIYKIFGFGGVGWQTPSTMAQTGNLYTYDANQNAIFPSGIRAVSGLTIGASISATGYGLDISSNKLIKFRAGGSFVNEKDFTTRNTMPQTNNTYSLGATNFQWKTIYGTTIYEGGTSLASKYASVSHNHDGTYILVSEKGANNGVATLDSSGKVPTKQLPSYVDDVLEYSTKGNFPETGEDGKIYVAEDTNLQYRWSGTQYVVISPSLALGETSSTAYSGDKGKANADAIAKILNGTSIVKKAYYDSSNNLIKTFYASKDELTSHTDSTNNPHSVTKEQLGLGNVNNVAITEAKVTQIGTNQTNIAEIINGTTTVSRANSDSNGDIISDTYLPFKTYLYSSNTITEKGFYKYSNVSTSVKNVPETSGTLIHYDSDSQFFYSETGKIYWRKKTVSNNSTSTSVSGTTGRYLGSTGYYEYCGEVNVGTGKTSVIITGSSDNVISYDSTSGVASYKLVSSSSNTTVSATIVATLHTVTWSDWLNITSNIDTSSFVKHYSYGTYHFITSYGNDRWYVMRGIGSFSSDSVTTTITLPVSMPNSSYTVVVSCFESSVSTGTALAVSNTTTTNFKVARNSSGVISNFYWIAMGRW